MNALETKTTSRPIAPSATTRPVLASTKIQPRHFERLAIIYVRQSSARQVQENIESTQLQYRLVDRAEALGWPRERVVVIDDDLGVSCQSIVGRVGFQRTLAEVSLDHVGMVLGLEMSRLARSCRDWHQLLELCSVFGTLLGDADGVYEPRDYNDRLLLELKGTMSEAELHILQGRLDAGKRNKARRVERAAYQVEIAHRRYSAVDAENRLVASELERQWEASLRAHRGAEEELERYRQRQSGKLTSEQREQIAMLSRDILQLWHAPTTSGVERQLILRAIVERITVAVQGETDRVSVTIRWSGGFESHHEIRRAVCSFDKLEGAADIVKRLNELWTAGYSYPAMAASLNAEGFHSAKSHPFTAVSTAQLCSKLRRQARIPESHPATEGEWRPTPLAKRLGVKPTTLNTWRLRGWVGAARIGSRWIYWADRPELDRLESLVAYARKRLQRTPAILTTPRTSNPNRTTTTNP